jgi:hypothetical protein
MGTPNDELGHITEVVDDDTKIGHLVTGMCGHIGPWKGKDHKPEAICPDCVFELMKTTMALRAELSMYQALMFPEGGVKEEEKRE